MFKISFVLGPLKQQSCSSAFLQLHSLARPFCFSAVVVPVVAAAAVLAGVAMEVVDVAAAVVVVVAVVAAVSAVVVVVGGCVASGSEHAPEMVGMACLGHGERQTCPARPYAGLVALGWYSGSP